jgi:RNA methyltransferase, TrmH family
MKHILSTSNDLVKHWARLQKERSYRQATGKVLVEGKNLLKDLIPRHKPLRFIVIQEDQDAVSSCEEDLIIISKEVASKISGVEEPEGWFAEYQLPASEIPSCIEKALILDRLQDPGNVGTILRTSLALNVRTVFLIEPCCDPWNPKAIRAAKGAQFDLSLVFRTWESIPADAPLFVADIKGEDIASLSAQNGWFLVLGNEAHGASIPPSYHPKFIKIPMPGPMESLNVSQAGAILLYMLMHKT